MSKTVLVTGAAGGIGTAICETLLFHGFTVIGFDKSPRVTGHISHKYYSGIVGDVTDTKTLEMASVKAGPLNHVISCAGIALPAESQSDEGKGLPSPEVFAASVELNLVSHYNTLWSFYENLLQADGDKSVTFTSSINAIQGFGLPAYSSAKSGLLGLTIALCDPLGSDGIRVNSLLPGTTPTPATLAEWAHVPDHWESMKAGSPLGKLATVDDIANGAYALTALLTHVSGTHLVIDGGQSVSRG